MEKKHGLDAIGYLIDPPRPASPQAGWAEESNSPDQRRKTLRKAIALKRRELEQLEANLAEIGTENGGSEPMPMPLAPPGLLRRLLGKVLPQTG